MGAAAEVIARDLKKRVVCDCERICTRTGQVVVQISVSLPCVVIRSDAVLAGAGKVVLLNRVAAGSPLDPNAVPAVGGDHVLNRVVGTRVHLNTDAGRIRSRPREAQIGEEVPGTARQLNGPCRGVGNGESLDRAVARGDGQYVAGDERAVDLDDRTIHVAGLGGAVDRDGVGDGGQGGAQPDHMRSRARDTENDPLFHAHG